MVGADDGLVCKGEGDTLPPLEAEEEANIIVADIVSVPVAVAALVAVPVPVELDVGVSEPVAVEESEGDGIAVSLFVVIDEEEGEAVDDALFDGSVGVAEGVLGVV